MQLFEQLESIAVWAVIDFCVSFLAAAHVVLHKRSARAAVGWMGVIWLAPFLGTSLYLLLGINRIERHAKRKRPSTTVELEPCVVPIADEHSVANPNLRDLMRLAGTISGLPLTAGNSVQTLVDGDEAYPAMLAAIDQATQSVTLATYIFDRDRVGLQFVAALGRAVSRGVRVRVLIDNVGASYRFPTVLGPLRRAHVPVAFFLPTLLPWRLQYSNLRNHRKVLIVDGRIAFTGGMNIRQGHEVKIPSRGPVRDLHFRIVGPVVGQLQEIFAVDWRFTTDELLSGPEWFACAEDSGAVAARCIADGPDESLDRTRKLLHGAISVARKSIAIVTPYFLPDDALITALNIAAMRGVTVDIFVPERGNLRFVQWAATSQYWQVLEHGCRLWLTPPPFDHTKIMLVDEEWALVGSTNWDPRSLRLNFELNVELYSIQCGAQLAKLIESRRQAGRRLTLADVNSRPLLIQLRDGVARLLSPYL
ncbi:MAG: cardiolipin synthase [Aureliella sp.]